MVSLKFRWSPEPGEDQAKKDLRRIRPKHLGLLALVAALFPHDPQNGFYLNLIPRALQLPFKITRDYTRGGNGLGMRLKHELVNP